MNNLIKLSLIFSPLLLTACVNQNTKAQKNLTTVTNPCQKISLLINAYDDGFEQVKLTKIKARISNTWKAKYNIIGDNCHIWTWGSSQSTYSCNITASDRDSAETHYSNAQQTIKQCLGDGWQMNEEPRIADKGRKSTFTNSNKEVTLSTHIVPSTSSFNNNWTIYYYVGNPN